MSLQGIQVPLQSIDRALQSLFFGASIHVQSIESWTVCMESVAISLNDSENLDFHAAFSLPYTCMQRLRPYGLILTGSLPRRVLLILSDNRTSSILECYIFRGLGARRGLRIASHRRAATEFRDRECAWRGHASPLAGLRNLAVACATTVVDPGHRAQTGRLAVGGIQVAPGRGRAGRGDRSPDVADRDGLGGLEQATTPWRSRVSGLGTPRLCNNS